MNLRIRRAGQADLPALTTLLNEALQYKLAHHDEAWGNEPYTEQEVSHRVNLGTTYVAVQNDQIVGTVMLLWEDPGMWGEQPQDAAYLHGLAVKDGFHGQDVGSQLLSWAASKAIKHGRHYLRLDCPADNKNLCRYYESHGFTRVATKTNPPHAEWAQFERRIS